MKSSYIKSCGITGFLFFTLLFFSLISQAQVGIGNTNPAASSMLDITSTEKGLLVPRMTTVQREDIPTPDNSLLVYDTDVESFFHFDATPGPGSWVKINSTANERNNYKLVKSAADFPAPSGGKITLVSNTFYEINGTITLTVPIDLNNAYVSGLDANEDIITKATGPIFQGTNGGSIRNVTLKGNETATAFNITGGTSLLVQNTIITGMSNVGSISNLGLYFGNIIQFLGNTNGITYTNIGNLLLSNQAWFSGNGGTYETFTGTFTQIQKVSGFSNVPTGATGLDVNTIGLSVGTGVLLGTVFSGAGTYVKSYPATSTYPGYNFSNVWNVDCPGIPREADAVATGDINLSVAGTVGVRTDLGTTLSKVKVAGTTTSNSLFRFEKVGNNRIVYKGSKKRYFQVNASLSYYSDGDPTIILYIAKNGTVISESKVYGRASNGFFVDSGILALPIVGTVELMQNEYIEVWAERRNGTGDLYTLSLNLTAR